MEDGPRAHQNRAREAARALHSSALPLEQACPERAVAGTLVPTLAWRPLQISSTQQMHVQMKHRLAGARPDVQDRAIAVFDAALPRHLRGCKMASADNLRVF